MEKEELIEFIEWLNKKNNVFSLYGSSTPVEVIIKDYLLEKDMKILLCVIILKLQI